MEEARYECNKFKLVGFIPSNINQHSKLNTLSLDDNMLNGKILNWCFTLPSLKTVESQWVNSQILCLIFQIQYLNLKILL